MRVKKIFLSIITGAAILSEAATFDMTGSQVVKFAYNIHQNTLYSYEDGITGDKSPYSAFYSCLVNDEMEIPLENYMVPQGITLLDDYILTTSYDYSNKDNSAVYVLNSQGDLLHTCSLYNHAHVGGIAYDKEHDLVWICGTDGCIDAYQTSSILNKKTATPIYANLNVGNGLPNYKNPLANSVSYLSIYQNELYVGSFSLTCPGNVKRYGISVDEETKTLTLSFNGSFSVPTKVQGLTFYEKGEDTYIMLSRSYGKYFPSILQIFSYDRDISSYDENLPSISYELPSMLEQVTVDDQQLYTIFESGAKPYENSLDPMTNICILNNEDLVKKLK